MSEQTPDIPHSHFTLEHLPPEERYDAWRDSISCIFTVESDSSDQRQNFSADVEAWQLHSMLMVRTTTLQQNWTRGHQEIARDGLDHYMIQLFLAGSTVTSHGKKATYDQLIIFDLSRASHTLTNNFTNLSLIIPRDTLAPLLNWPDHQHLRVLSTASPLVAMLKDHIQSLHRQANYLDLATAESLTPATINLVAGCLNSSIEDLPLTHELDAMTEVRRVRHYIATNLSDPDLSPAIICSALGISRSRLYRIFSPYGGIAAYIRESRLHTAFQALIRSEQISLKLYEIAQSCGFRSNADFSRSFRKQYDLSPKEIRQKPGLLLRADNHSNIDRRYEQWLTRLTS